MIVRRTKILSLSSNFVCIIQFTIVLLVSNVIGQLSDGGYDVEVVNTTADGNVVISFGTAPVSGSFKIRFPAADSRDVSSFGEQVAASIQFNSTVVESCYFNVSEINPKEWYDLEWILAQDQFYCILGGKNGNKLHSNTANVTLDWSDFKLTTGDGNNSCVANVTVLKRLLMECPPSSPPSCDCVRTKSERKNIGTVTSGQIEANRTAASPIISRFNNTPILVGNFPTPGPFLGNTGSTARAKTSTPRSTTLQTLKHEISDLNFTTNYTSPKWLECNETCVNGECIAEADQYLCRCTTGYSGTWCDERNCTDCDSNNETSSKMPIGRFPEDVCLENKCENGGTCKPDVEAFGGGENKGFRCFCEPYYMGERCQHVNPCLSANPCLNGGQCSPVVPFNGSVDIGNSTFRCHCPREFDGPVCELKGTVPSTVPSNISDCSVCDFGMQTCPHGAVIECLEETACFLASDASYCQCVPSVQTGDPCRQAAAVDASGPDVGAIVGGVIGGLCVLALIVGLIFLYRYVQKSRKLKVFLGGSCGESNWRQNLVIPHLRRTGITFYNPYRTSWTPDMIEMEEMAKSSCRVLLFVIDIHQMNVVSFIEIAYLAAKQAPLIVVLPSDSDVQKGYQNENSEDRLRAVAFLRSVLHRHKIPQFLTVAEALAMIEAVVIGERRFCDAIRDASCRYLYIRIMMKRSLRKFSTMAANAAYCLSPSQLVLPFRDPKVWRIFPPRSLSDWSKLNLLIVEILVFIALCVCCPAVPAVFIASGLVIAHISCLKRFLMRWCVPRGRLRSQKAKAAPASYDVYLGGSGNCIRLSESVLPMLNKNGLSYLDATFCELSQRLTMLPFCRSVLYVVACTDTFLSGLVELAYFIGTGINLVGCIDANIPSRSCRKRDLESCGLTEKTAECYRRGLLYLKDMARRSSVPIFDNLSTALVMTVEQLRVEDDS